MSASLTTPTCCGRHLYDGNREALGYQLESIGRSMAFISVGAFVSTSLLILAKEAAGCETEIPEGETELPACNNRVYGIRPSSLLTTYSIVNGIVGAFIAPVMGAIIDFTDHRLLIGQVLFVIHVAVLAPSIFLSSQTWFLVAICQIIYAIVGQWMNGIRYSFLPELTQDKTLLNKWIASFVVGVFGSMVGFVVFVVVVSTAIGIVDDDLSLARLSAFFGVVIEVSMLTVAWMFYLKPRKATNALKEGQTLWTAGFIQVYNTSQKLVHPSFRALKWFYIQNALSDGMIEAMATIAITFATDVLEFSVQENGIAILVLLLGSIFGGGTSQVFVTRLGSPVHSAMCASVIMLITTTLAGIILKGPGQQLIVYVIVFSWGFCMGWKRAGDEFMASTLIPKNQNTELMGFFMFSRVCLTWFPPLIFTTLNEAGIQQRLILISLNIMFALALGALWMMGTYDSALEKLKEQEDTAALPEKGAVMGKESRDSEQGSIQASSSEASVGTDMEQPTITEICHEA